MLYYLLVSFFEDTTEASSYVDKFNGAFFITTNRETATSQYDAFQNLNQDNPLLVSVTGGGGKETIHIIEITQEELDACLKYYNLNGIITEKIYEEGFINS